MKEIVENQFDNHLVVEMVFFYEKTKFNADDFLLRRLTKVSVTIFAYYPQVCSFFFMWN